MTNKKKGLFPLVVGALAGAAAVFFLMKKIVLKLKKLLLKHKRILKLLQKKCQKC
jgi:uncharacterized membrane protein YdjX (TVP38/TMEM64 family)